MTSPPSPKILYVTSDVEDYLADSVLHGLKTLYGVSVVDFPRCERVYDGFPEAMKRAFHGQGFTLYSHGVPDLPVDRMHITQRVRAQEFDLIIFGDIWRQVGHLLNLWSAIGSTPVAFLDGADSDQPFPFAGLFARQRLWWVLPRIERRGPYFKREWTSRTQFGFLRQRLPHWIRSRLKPHSAIRPLSFSVPAQYVVSGKPQKQKTFVKHIVDPDVRRRVATSSCDKPFQHEGDYVADIRASRFGITMKRAGWDCLRHYEVAANGAVPCFRHLTRKPPSCAPHGLGPHNCISYESADELLERVHQITDEQYAAMQSAAMDWARHNTTVARARQLLRECRILCEQAG